VIGEGIVNFLFPFTFCTFDFFHFSFDFFFLFMTAIDLLMFNSIKDLFPECDPHLL
jgi:hypothetical protein